MPPFPQARRAAFAPGVQYISEMERVGQCRPPASVVSHARKKILNADRTATGSVDSDKVLID